MSEVTNNSVPVQEVYEIEDLFRKLEQIEAKLDGLRRFIFATAPRKPKVGK